ncbi:MAG TPA: aminotransferase class I/II-fold pyridoxal phosphate-dependent enzyme [Caulobacteraceae bacterium]|nr:aminotransferase class I/II-fold pyridoxal phosphate-dependent enzyme [Caulobacteraceae bacterium]
MPIPATKPYILPDPTPQRIPIAHALLPAHAAIAPYLERIDQARCYSNFGPLVTELEARLAARFKAPTGVVTVANGTTAIALALEALGCDPGGLCIVPAFTFCATAHAARQAGLELWFLDVDPETWMLDPATVAEALKTAPGPVEAIVPVGAFGRLPDLEAWARLSRETGIPVVVDAAAAFDALDAAPVPVAVSLHATKSVSTGEGGFVAAQDPAFLQRVRELSAFGFRGARIAHMGAHNAKLSEYAAAVGLASLDAWPQTRSRYAFAAQHLRVALALAPEIEFQPGWGTAWFSSVCVVGTPEGQAAPIAAALDAAGIDTRAWWGEGCHTHPAFEHCLRTDLPVTRRLAASTLGLPFFVDLAEAQAWRIVDALMSALKEL